MSTKRDYIAEILQKKGRLLRRAEPEEQFSRRLHPVVAGFRFIKNLKTSAPLRAELLKYGPIGYVACLEGYFRLVIKQLIDSGSPYAENAIGFEEIRFGISTVVAITSRKITLGEYIAHLVTLNNLSDINRCFSIVLGRDFLTELKSLNISERPDGKALTIIDLSPTVLADVEELFRLRNIYAHELATSEPVKPRKIEACIGAAAMFYTTANDYFVQFTKRS
jgi:hypothetical protein